ncbi:MAG TPA: DUF692 domain-containing protein [Cellvibrionaceae bacterium]
MTGPVYPVSGAGLGLRRALLQQLADVSAGNIDFMEIAPENWIGVGGRLGKQLRRFTERYPFVCHGLSLSIGSSAPLDRSLLTRTKAFLAEHNIRCYTEHLSYCSDDGQLYDLLPIPFTEESVHYVAARVRQAQDILGQRIALENASYYCAPGQQMSELEFIQAVVAEADCDLLLDVNNAYVNGINHRYDPLEFIASLPLERVVYMHVAGHYHEAEDLRVDTHGAPIIDPVWQLLQQTYRLAGAIPTLLERDFNFPPMPELLAEVDHIRQLQQLAPAVSERVEAGALQA